MVIYASDKQFWGQSDSQTIQNAIDHAEKTGLGRVVIPRHNDRTGEEPEIIWVDLGCNDFAYYKDTFGCTFFTIRISFS